MKVEIKPDKDYKPVGEWACWLCGEQRELYTDVVSSNFNNFEDVQSLNFCYDCCWLFNAEYRKKSFYITEKEAKTVSQKEFLDILNNLEFPCILSFTDTNKKHRLFRHRVSYDKSNVVLVTDNWYVVFDLDVDLPILNAINDFYANNKVSKSRILEWSYPIGAIKKVGLEEYNKIESLVKPLRWSDKLKYMVAFCNKE